MCYAKKIIMHIFRYIKLKYLHGRKQNDFINIFTTESSKSKPHQFIEGLVFNQDHGVIMVGDLVDSPQNDGKVICNIISNKIF